MKQPHPLWSPVREADWDVRAARHLASRLGFSTRPDFVDFILRKGSEESLEALLGKRRAFHPGNKIAGMRREMAAYREQLAAASETGKREIRQQMGRDSRKSLMEYALDWYAFARDPANTAQENLVLFFQNVWVVAFQGVRSVPALHDYSERIRKGLHGSYPDLCKSLARSPAMVRYLNLNQNRKGTPNENFARELFELFCLGEGNYTEHDIKEAARATTGYYLDGAGTVRLGPRRHDPGKKTIFGETDTFDMPGLIDLVFRQPAAATFLPGELARAFLTEEGLPTETLQPLADSWKASGFSIPHLLGTFFSSRIFHSPEYRGNLIKSPVHFYLGLLQDLDLDVFPSPRRTNNLLRLMGQPFFNPPNVRGWIGGRHWINSATLAARRQTVKSLLHEPPEKRLNADEQAAVAAARAAGKGSFTVGREILGDLAREDPGTLAARLADRFYADPDPLLLRRVLAEIDRSAPGGVRGAAILVAALTAPPYHLC